MDNLSKSKLGLENLILTYASSPNTIAKLRVYILNIEMILKKYNYIHPMEINNSQNKFFNS
jgi:hypothetical protein